MGRGSESEGDVDRDFAEGGCRVLLLLQTRGWGRNGALNDTKLLLVYVWAKCW